MSHQNSYSFEKNMPRFFGERIIRQKTAKYHKRQLPGEKLGRMGEKLIKNEFANMN